MSRTETLKARFDGAKAAMAGKKLDANPYGESNPLHFEWLAAYADARVNARIKRASAAR